MKENEKQLLQEINQRFLLNDQKWEERLKTIEQNKKVISENSSEKSQNKEEFHSPSKLNKSKSSNQQQKSADEEKSPKGNHKAEVLQELEISQGFNKMNDYNQFNGTQMNDNQIGNNQTNDEKNYISFVHFFKF